MSNQRDVRAGRAFVELYIQDGRFTRGLQRAQMQLRSFELAIRGIATSMMKLSALMIAPLAASGRVFLNYSDNLLLTKAVTRSTIADFERLRDIANEAGKSAAYTPTQTTAALVELGRAGFNATEIDHSAESVLNLSRATGTELADATKYAVTTLRAFNLESTEIERVCDVLGVTANGSTQILDDLGESIKYAAPIAEEFNTSLEETCYILGVLANQNIAGSMSGTSFRRILLGLADPAVQDMLARRGVKVVDEQTGAARNLMDILSEIRVMMDDLSNVERLALFDKLFDKRAAGAAIKMTKQDFATLAENIKNSRGQVREWAQEMNSGFGGAWRAVLRFLDVIANTLGGSLSTTLGNYANILMAIEEPTRQWISDNQDVIVGVVTLAGTLAVMAAVLLTVSTITGIVSGTFGLLAGVVNMVQFLVVGFGTVLGNLIMFFVRMQFVVTHAQTAFQILQGTMWALGPLGSLLGVVFNILTGEISLTAFASAVLTAVLDVLAATIAGVGAVIGAIAASPFAVIILVCAAAVAIFLAWSGILKDIYLFLIDKFGWVLGWLGDQLAWLGEVLLDWTKEALKQVASFGQWFTDMLLDVTGGMDKFTASIEKAKEQFDELLKKNVPLHPFQADGSALNQVLEEENRKQRDARIRAIEDRHAQERLRARAQYGDDLANALKRINDEEKKRDEEGDYDPKRHAQALEAARKAVKETYKEQLRTINKLEASEKRKEERRQRQEELEEKHRIRQEQMKASTKAMIEMQYKDDPTQKQLALLDMQKAEWIQQAKGDKATLELIERRFKAESALIRSQTKKKQMQDEVRGTFNPYAVRGMGARSQLAIIAEATRETAANTKALIEKRKPKPLTFGN